MLTRRVASQNRHSSGLPVGLMKLSCILVLLATCGVVSAQQTDEPQEAEKLFALKVRPLLQEKCFACHGRDPENMEGNFDLTSRAGLLKGGDSFGTEVVIPGKAAESHMYSMVTRTDADFAMPPKEAEKLTEEQTWWIRDWINGGAPWPNDARIAEIYDRYAEGVTWKTSGGLSAEWTRRKYRPEDLWAWQPLWQDSEQLLRAVAVEEVIDWFVQRRLKTAGLQSAPLTDRRTYIRRATFDLIGLPPAPQDVEAFVNDTRSDEVVYAELVDRLLASNHYGEQWGRHWLDVVRYADSSGFANDWERPNAWRYRDYVIRAFNSDKPYNRFVTEQLAGDELADQTAAVDSELQIAAGFLRMGPWEHTAMSVAKVTRQMFLDDVTDSVGQVFLGHALQCCRCHDHKFDPIPTRDYYSFQAVFATTQFAEVVAKWLPEENLTGMKEDREYLRKKQDANRKMLSELSALKAANQRKWFEEQGLPYKTVAEAREAKAPKEHFPPKLLMTPDQYGRERIGRKWQTRFAWEFDRYADYAFSVYSGKTPASAPSQSRRKKPDNPLAAGRLQKTFILTGGSPFSEAAEVQPGVLSAVPGGLEFRVPEEAFGRRLALAEWITDPRNSLTARVMVNRIWHYHFGRGIAANPNNFGTTGKKPTHPELLDWLAGEFIRSGWSVKAMHRLILLSDTYRRSTAHPHAREVAVKDPDNRLYSRFSPRRLAAEEIRDSMLFVSGELNPQQGGIPVRPDMNLEAALQPRMIMGTFAPSYVPNPLPKDRNRRSVYALRLRGLRDPMMETFNQPGSEKSCEMRDSSTVSPQALTLLNSAESADRALAFAASVLKVAGADDSAAVAEIFRRAYGRHPSDDEMVLTLKHWREMESRQLKLKFEPRDYPTEVVRRAVEENTGELFTFTEHLFVYEDYVHDLQPQETDARTRALADVCLAVLNSNEFVFVY